MKDSFGNDVKLLDAVVFSSCNQLKFGIVIDVRDYIIARYDWQKYSYNLGKRYSNLTVLYWNDGTLVKASPRKGFVKVGREYLPMEFQEMLVKNGY